MIIYKMTNIINNKVYIGQTQLTLSHRMSQHIHRNVGAIDKAIKKYGIDNFKVEVIEECHDLDELNEREKYWIETLNCKSPNGYNLTDGGEGVAGYHHTSETKIKMSLARKGHKKSPEMRAKLSATLKGRTFSPETRKKMSEAAKKRGLSSALRAKISEANRKRIVSPETRAKLSANWKGRKHTPEAKAKMSAAKKGIKLPSETRNKMSMSHKQKNRNKLQSIIK